MKDLFEYLSTNEYPGRGLLLGQNVSGETVLAYFIMGRSANSRNRIFTEEKDAVTIYPFDAEKAGDPSLIIYSPLRTFNNYVIVTNGDQTDTIYDYLQKGDTFENALDTRCYEPDAPNYTPRISGLIDLSKGSYKINILKKHCEQCQRLTYDYALQKGAGRIIHTYKQDGNPLPSYSGEPTEVNICDNIDDFTAKLWKSLNNDNKISLVVKYYGDTVQTRIINKNI